MHNSISNKSVNFMSQYIGTSAIMFNGIAVKRRMNIFLKYPKLKKKFENYSEIQLYKQMVRQRHILLINDILTCAIDIVIVCWLYFDNFDYVENDYQLKDSDNICRIFCLVLSLIVVSLLLLRNYNKQTYENLKYLQNLRSNCNLLYNNRQCTEIS